MVTAVLPMINMFPQQLHGALPAPDAVAPLVRAFVFGAKAGTRR